MSQTARTAPRLLGIGVKDALQPSAHSLRVFFDDACRVACPSFHTYIHVEPLLTRHVFQQFPCGRVKRFLKNNTQNKMRVGAKGMSNLSPRNSSVPRQRTTRISGRLRLISGFY